MTIHLTIDGVAVPLCPEAVTMILALADHQLLIRKQGAGTITINYNGTDQTLALSKLTFRTKARHP